MINVITLFSGYDSQCLALDRQGIDYDLVAWSDIDKSAIKAHNVLFPQWADRNLGDVAKVEWSVINKQIDLLTYSSPCQDFSTAGLQRGGEAGSGTRSSLLWEVERAVKALRPKYLLLENVSALVSEKFLPLFGRWCNVLEGYGYHNTWQVMNAKDYGVPQNRERVFLVSKLDDETPYYFPRPFKLEKRLKDVLEQNVDERYYLSEERVKGLINHKIKQEEAGNGFGFKPKTSDSLVAGAITTREGQRGCDNYIAELRCQQVGQLDGVYESSGRVYSPDGLSPTINTCQGGQREPKIAIPNAIMARTLDKALSKPTDNSVWLDAYNEAVYEDVAPTITTRVEANNCNRILEREVATFAMRGRDKDNPNDRGRSTENYEQRLEIGSEDTANTITTVAKDSMVVIGSMQKNAFVGPIDGVSPCINAACGMGGGQTPMVTEEIKSTIISPGHGYFDGAENAETCPMVKRSAMQAQHFVKETTIPTIIEDFYRTVREPRTFTDTAPTLRAERTELKVSNGIRVRKLTERELYRLMDVDEDRIDQLLASDIARTQHAKLAGNNIVVACLYYIFDRLFVHTQPMYGEQLRLC